MTKNLHKLGKPLSRSEFQLGFQAITTLKMANCPECSCVLSEFWLGGRHFACLKAEPGSDSEEL
jgi:hypothetical protein